jgi:hypothetical protein
MIGAVLPVCAGLSSIRWQSLRSLLRLAPNVCSLTIFSRLFNTDSNNVKYLVKLPQADKLEIAKEATSKEKVSSWEVEQLGTALSTGDHPLPLGIALKISH